MVARKMGQREKTACHSEKRVDRRSSLVARMMGQREKTACYGEKQVDRRSFRENKGKMGEKRPPVNPNSGWTGGLLAYSIELLFGVPVRDSFDTPVS